VTCVVCEGQIHLQLVLEFGSVRAYLTPAHFIMPRSEWVLLMLTCNGLQVASLVYCSEVSKYIYVA